ncbi:MAG: S8 family serine peptidase [Thermoplasmatota archaeon]
MHTEKIGRYRILVLPVILVFLSPAAVMNLAFEGSEMENGPIWWAHILEGLPNDSNPDEQYIDPLKDIVIGRYIFDPREDADYLEKLPEVPDSGQYIVQFYVPIHIKMLQTLEGRSCTVQDVISQRAVLVHCRDSRALETDDDDIRAVVKYHPFFKIENELLSEILNEPSTELLDVVIGLYNLPLDSKTFFELGIDPSEFLVDSYSMLAFASMDRATILRTANEPWVSHISDMDIRDLDNDIASDIIDVSETQRLLGLDGTGQVVAVCDTGLDTGRNSTMHPDLTGRIKAAYAYGRSGNWSDPDIHVWDSSSGSWSYKGGHGTHVTGSVLGNGSASNGSYAGMAPEAELVFQSTMDSTGSLATPAYFTLYRDAYESGARIQTNSWSSRSSYGNYSWRSWQTDNYLWGSKDLTVLYSAGNQGSLGTYSISTQSLSKNVIAVGASESYRPSLGSWGDNISEIATFSSQGPTWGDNRVKPDVAAPGTWILSTRASTISDFWNHYWGSNSTYNGINSRYAYMGGTSMSTPITAGTVALIRQYYQDLEKISDPSAALIKATLINGARPLNGNWSSVPNRFEGWGRANLTNSLCTNDSDAGVLRFIDNSSGLATGSTHSRLYTVKKGSSDLVATLVWTDYPGSNTSSVKLVNDLDLTITAPNGTVYRGNGLLYSQQSQADRRNNVERIFIRSPTTGIYKVNVTGYSVAMGPQPYSLVMSGDFTGAAGSIAWEEEYLAANGSTAHLTLSDSNLTGRGWTLIKVHSSSDATGEILNLTEVKQGGSGIGIFRGSVKVVTTSPIAGEVQVTSDGNITATYTEDYPKRTLKAQLLALIPPKINSVSHNRIDETLTYQDEVTVSINGTAGWAASFDVVGLSSRYNIQARDDGIIPDPRAGDGIYTGLFSVPNLVAGNFTLRASIKRSYLPPAIGEADEPVRINTNIPRKPRNLTVSPVPSGNRLLLTWESPGDINLMSYVIFRANESEEGSGLPGAFQQIHMTPDNRTNYTDTGLTDGSLYFYKTSSFNILGFHSGTTEPVSGIPRDEKAPWFVLEQPLPGMMVSGDVVFNFTTEDDAVKIVFQGSPDRNGDMIPDRGWLEIGTDPSPSDPFTWDTRDLPLPLEEGENILIGARLEDEVGNSNETGPLLTVRVDNTPPSSLSIFSPLIKAQNSSVYQLTGSSEWGSRIVVKKDGKEFITGTSDINGNFLLFLNLDEGENEFQVMVYDDLGNGPVLPVPELLVVYDPYEPVAVFKEVGATTSHPFKLDGSPSSDRDQDSRLTGIVNYSWAIQLPTGNVLLYGMEPSVRIPIPGIFGITLTVKDWAGNQDSVRGTLKVNDTDAPKLVQMEDMIVDEDVEVSLPDPMIIDNDPGIYVNGDFLWIVTGHDHREFAEREVKWTFVTPGIYNVKLRITDTGGNLDETEFNITVRDLTQPNAFAGKDRTVVRGAALHLSASGSTDNDPDFPEGSNFTWVLKESGETLYGMDIEVAFDILGTQRVWLKVIDPSSNVGTHGILVHVTTDGTPPYLIEWSLSGEQAIAMPGEAIRFIFNETMDPQSIFQGVHMVGPAGIDLAIELELLGGSEIKVTPTEPLNRGKEYTIILDADLKDATGEPFNTREFKFRVIDELRWVSISIGNSQPGHEEDLGPIDPGTRFTIRTNIPVDPSSRMFLTWKNVEYRYLTGSLGENGTAITFMIPEDLAPGDYSMVLEAMDMLGYNISDGSSFKFKIVEEGRGEGDGSDYGITLIPIIVIIIIVLASAFVISLITYRRRRGNGTGVEEEGERRVHEELHAFHDTHHHRKLEEFHPPSRR